MTESTIPRTPGLSRRGLGLALAGTAAAAALPASLAATPAVAYEAGPDGLHQTVRLGVVGAVQTGGMFNQLLTAFQAESGYQVQVTPGMLDSLYGLARTGGLDIVISHLGTEQLQDFVTDRFGRWPQQILTTAFVFIAPPDDPADILGLDDAVEAFSRIAQSQSPFIVNNLASVLYLTDTLWHAAGTPDQQGWYLDLGVSAAMAVQAARQRGGYTIWGLHPFLMFQQQQQSPMRAALYSDSLLQRVIASVVVHPGKVHGVNIAGALALERFLTRPSTQAQIRNFRLPAFNRPIFWSAAHHNDHGAEPG